MSLESVKHQFAQFGIEEKIMIFDTPSATVSMAAQDIGCEEAEICKTMAFDVGGETIVIAMAGDVRIDNRKYKDYFHKKAKMLQGDEVVEKTTHPIGGVCPFGLPDNVQIYLDDSLKRFVHVYPACGSINSAICLTINELEMYSNAAKWIDISKQIVYESASE